MSQTPYDDLSLTCLADARTALAAGNLQQAADKGWEAASHKVHALAQAWGWTPENPREPWATYNLVSRLTRESSEQDLSMLFAAAGHLRTAPFDGMYADMDVEHSLKRVNEFMSTLDRMLVLGGPVLPHSVREEPEQPYSGQA